MNSTDWHNEYDRGELGRLISALCDGAITPEGELRLNELLRDDLSAQEYYVESMMFHGILRWEQRDLPRGELPWISARGAFENTEELGLPLPVIDPPGQISDQPSEMARGISGPIIPSQEPSATSGNGAVLGISSDPEIGPSGIGPSISPITNYLTSNWFAIGSIGIFLFLIGVTLYAVLSPSRNGNSVAESGKESNSGIESKEEVHGIDRLHLESGTVSMRIPGVGYVVAEGPADLELVTPMRMVLNRGRIKVRVEPSGYGFVVETPHGEVIDLGTEFGVDVSNPDATDLVVFEGAVDLRMPGAASGPTVERLIGGEGIRFDKGGRFDRIVSISTFEGGTFQKSGESLSSQTAPVILDISDNLRSKQTKSFYEIVHQALDEDVLAYVDRTYQWNGIDKSGMPDFLIGADYVKMFNDDKLRSLEITLKLAQAAELYLIWDNRVPPPEWLIKDFTNTGLSLGMDEAPYKGENLNYKLGVGPGNAIDIRCSIWHRHLDRAQDVKLGALGIRDDHSLMYGIAAIPSVKDSNSEKAMDTENIK